MDTEPEERSCSAGVIEEELVTTPLVDAAGTSGISPEKGDELEPKDPSDNNDIRMSRDRDHLLSIFPEDLWYVLLESIKDPQELENVSNASLYFRSLLLPKRVLRLFPKVWDILAGHFNKSPPEILPLRLVCRAWSNTVDNFHENLDMYTHESVCRWATEQFSETMSFDGEQFQHFQLHFEHSHGVVADFADQPERTGGRNPFFGRTILIEFSVYPKEPYPITFFPEHTHHFLEQLLELLSKHGHHFRNCCITFGVDTLSPLECYSGLRSLLETMPNLKVLRLRFETGFNTLRVAELNAELLEMELARLPTLEHLGTLETFVVPPVLFQQVLQSNPHVTKIRIAPRLVNTEGEFYDLGQARLPNLKQLSMDVRTEADLEMLENPHNNWPLTSFRKLSFLNSRTFTEWSRVFDLLGSKWAGTLTHLCCSLPFAQETDDQDRIIAQCADLRLNLPHLKYLALAVNNVTSLEFIVPMKDTLQHLEITFDFCFLPFRGNQLERMAVECERRGTLKVVTYLDNLEESNVWELFPKLKKFYCKWDVREERLAKVAKVMRPSKK